ncbi:MAG: extracellular solute-binding protein [Dactylosporangium sp.]|nr:extracellular solute-binding protein [Dactylosporangium sp.]NNJ63878.1 extracellular solute-binding protein [Dactylosporangium sp.]
MGLSKRHRGAAAVAMAAVAVFASASACSEDSDSGDDGQITLTVDVFGDQGFGYEALYERYMEQHPNIKIEERGKGFALNDYNTRLTQWIASSSGAGDIVALEEGTIVQFKAQSAQFVNLLDYGAGAMEQDFLAWKWKQGQTADGKQLIGLGTDIGSMAICYRKDLFAKANLPTDREAVGALWPTWEKFIETGKTYVAAEESTKFVDAATNFYNVVLMQVAGTGTGYTYFNTNEKFVLDSNPDIKAAWQLTVDMIDSDLSAGLRSFSDAWNTGFKQAQFATIACPAWMTGVIKGQAGDDAAGKWDVAKAPGTGGNWGGSFLAVPKQSKHPKEAAELAKFLTGAEGQIEAFNKLGNLPSNPRALQDPVIVDFKNEYFSDAPTGEIFAAGATSLKPVYLGPKNQAVRDEIENALRSIEQEQRTADQAWQDAVQNGTNAGK